MLERVRRTWISGYLDDSLNGTALVGLGLQERPDAVVDRWGLVVQALDPTPRTLSLDTSITGVFDKMDSELLILGEPGAGKTTLLLELASTLLTRAEEDGAQPIPVVFPLSPWALNRQSLDEWLVAELDERYDVPRTIGRVWVANDQILPLLDGLDEVAPAYREQCIAAINQFIETRARSLVRLVLASRAEDYLSLESRLRLRSAVIIEPLSPDQVDAYLAGVGEQVDHLRAALQSASTLRELSASPLMLSTMALAYQDTSVDSLPHGENFEACRTQLFSSYVDSMFRRRSAKTEYTDKQANIGSRG